MAPASVARTASAMTILSAATSTIGLKPRSQCLKWRRPVKTMAMWCRSATSMAISSRMLPPG
jgi:hypothetical protein